VTVRRPVVFLLAAAGATAFATGDAAGRPTAGRPTAGSPTAGRPTADRPTADRPTASTAAEPAPKPGLAWLIVAASDATPAGIVRKAKALSTSLPRLLVVRTLDCAGQKDGFALVTAVADSMASAQKELPAARGAVADAYVKRCDVLPRSLLDWRVSAVDASIAEVPEDAVNWEDEDRISSVVALGGERAAIVVRYFVNAPEDPLEGRRQRVLLARASGQKTLVDDCAGAAGFTAKGGHTAFQCEREQAGDALLHRVFVYCDDGRRLAEVPHCRAPRWSGGDTLVCENESVDASGQLKLETKRTRLPSDDAANSRCESTKEGKGSGK
jgi:hypothetical protein